MALMMGSGEASYERPPPSALLTTFQRLGFSTSPTSGETRQDPKRLRVCVGDTRPPSEMDSPTAEMELPQCGSFDSPSQLPAQSSWSAGSGLPSPYRELDPHAHASMVQDDSVAFDAAAHRRSPSDHERLSPVSQLLLAGRPGLLHRHLASLRQQEVVYLATPSNGSSGGGGGPGLPMGGAPACSGASAAAVTPGTSRGLDGSRTSTPTTSTRASPNRRASTPPPTTPQPATATFSGRRGGTRRGGAPSAAITVRWPSAWLRTSTDRRRAAAR